MSTVGHRPGAFKQTNKKHKTGRHRAKGSISDNARGRLTVKIHTRSSLKDQNKLVRRHQANQIRLHKRHQLIDMNRSIGGQNLPILTVRKNLAVISLDEDYSASEFIGLLCTCDDEVICKSITKGYINHLWCPRFKRYYQFINPNLNCLDELLRVVSAADVVVFLWPLSGEISEEVNTAVTVLAMYGLPTTVHFAPRLSTINKPKVKESIRISMKKLMDKWSFGNCKLLNCDNNTDGVAALRLLSEIKKKRTVLQKRHSYLVCEKAEALDKTNDGLCALKLTGYVRGLPMNVNNLLHIQGYGDFQMKQIEVEDDPNIPKKHTVAVRKEVLVPDPALQMSLVSENIPDPMDAEQTWPEKEEFPKDAFETRRVTKKVPVGTSAYQAAWIVDDYEDEEDDHGDKSDEEACVDSVDGDQNRESMEFECEQSEGSTCEDNNKTEDDNDDNETVAMEESIEDMTIDQSLVDKFRQERMNAQFPDEIDTPIDIAARIRFQRYRGLKSFRTSPWDPAENLPLSYARIFKFADYKHSRKAAFASVREENEFTVSPGSYVSVLVNNVPLELIDTFNKTFGLVVYSLLPHEQRMTVVNMVLKKFTDYAIPIVNKQKLLFYVGYRRFEAQPIFSQHTNGDKFKMERFMPTQGAFVASVFAPAMFPPAPVFVFSEDNKGRRHLVASGRILDLNPDRIVLKRVVLSGHPFRIYRRHCVVRYMFFNREDIEWFKPIELYTTRGRRGNITEALGTHGYMKCIFDQHLNAMDSVMLNLYKRVYPKWSYNPLVANKLYDAREQIEEMDTKN
uniref:Pre-rRNA-processing protein TSR1 homolog n=1 Tax=Syphacia muris TaxID=451379 RepID=A0A0N5AK54_9BILA